MNFHMTKFFQLQVSLLILNMADEFSNESFCTVIFDEFFLAGLGRDNVTRHLLKLLWYIHPKLPSARLHSLLKALQPTSQVILYNLDNFIRYNNYEDFVFIMYIY